MLRHELRLEILKLTHTLGRSAEEAIDRAKKLEAYILESDQSLMNKLGSEKKTVYIKGDNSKTSN